MLPVVNALGRAGRARSVAEVGRSTVTTQSNAMATRAATSAGRAKPSAGAGLCSIVHLTRPPCWADRQISRWDGLSHSQSIGNHVNIESVAEFTSLSLRPTGSAVVRQAAVQPTP